MHSSAPLGLQSNISGYSGNRVERSRIPSHRKAMKIIITKRRISAFVGADLAMILRVNDIDMLVLYGIATSGVVLSTLVEAADADYRVAVIGEEATSAKSGI